jgi:hypothetical protein
MGSSTLVLLLLVVLLIEDQSICFPEQSQQRKYTHGVHIIVQMSNYNQNSTGICKIDMMYRVYYLHEAIGCTAFTIVRIVSAIDTQNIKTNYYNVGKIYLKYRLT